MSFTELARKTGLSGAAAQQRVRRLEQRGVIKGYAALINPDDAGLPLTAFVSIRPFDPAADDDAPQRLAHLSAIEACHSVAGGENYMLKVRVASPAALENLLQQIRAGSAGTCSACAAPRWPGRSPPTSSCPGRTACGTTGQARCRCRRTSPASQLSSPARPARSCSAAQARRPRPATLCALARGKASSPGLAASRRDALSRARSRGGTGHGYGGRGNSRRAGRSVPRLNPAASVNRHASPEVQPCLSFRRAGAIAGAGRGAGWSQTCRRRRPRSAHRR
jgi:Lrp/AsnC family transcriptional regulator, leucine-responsive regulatory protein